MRTKVECDYCGNLFEKENKEINRCKKRKMGNYCDRSCTAHYRNNLMTDEYWMKQYEKQKKTFDIKSQCGNRRDEYSCFRFYSRKNRFSIIRHKNQINIDEKYLKEIWDKQMGICPYTGIKMLLPKTTHQCHQLKSLKKASLDRIDSSKGYLKGNVEFVCMAVNLAKNNHTKEEMLYFVKDIISSQNTLSITQEQPT